MEFVPSDKESNTPTGISLADFTRSVMMGIYQEKNPDASEIDIANAHNEIETLISDVKQWFEKTMRPINATTKLAEKQYALPSNLVELLADEVVLSDNLDITIKESAQIQKHIDTAIEELYKNVYITPYDTLFQQTITAYKSELYDLAVLGFFAIIDGLLSDITNDHGSVRIKQRTEKVVNIDSFRTQEDHAALQKLSLLMVSELLSESKPFSGAEPETLNRHWAMHGRTRTKKTKADCEKLIMFIYSLISTAEDANEE